MEPGAGQTLVGWRGQPLAVARELGTGMPAVERFQDLALDAEAAADPSAAFRRHVGKSAADPDRFAPEDRERLTRELGHFHPAQSLASGDSIAWNTFGPFARPRASRRWLNEVLSAAFGPADYPEDWIVRLWHREEVSVPGMVASIEVEAPATAIAIGGWKFIFAARWQRDFPEGIDDTLTLHLSQLVSSDPARSGLLVIVPSARRYPPARDAESVFSRHFTPAGEVYFPSPAIASGTARARIVTWESLAERTEVHPHGVELGDYLRWRLAILDELTEGRE
ncbi:MAG TPA: hypothetical protein DFS52_10195 [Myxococcales bacterium]|nr:hypothetical protein [Myxococcales bacterium]